jgi:hypothetical protein
MSDSIVDECETVTQVTVFAVGGDQANVAAVTSMDPFMDVAAW